MIHQIALSEHPLISRFTIALLSSILLGMSFGHALTTTDAELAWAATSISLMFFVYEFVRNYLAEANRMTKCRANVEQRLYDQMLAIGRSKVSSSGWNGSAKSYQY